MSLNGILKVIEEQPQWVDWTPGVMENKEAPDQPRGFAILLRPPDASDIQGLASAAIHEGVRKIMNEEGGEGRLKPGTVGVTLLNYLVADWRGFTGRGLRYFAQGSAALQVEAPEEIDIPFNRELLEVLLQKSFRFYDFVDRAWREQEQKTLAAREEDAKNLSSAPDSTPIPSGAPGAPKTTKGSKRRSSVTDVSGPTGG